MNYNYFLQVGNKGSKRLEILNQLYNSSSQEFLLRSGLKQGMKVLEVGGGTGTLSCWVAKQIGTSGNINIIDSSAEQVSIIQKKIKKYKIQNMKVEVSDIQQVNAYYEQFDLIYCRFLLVHLQKPKEIISKFTNFLKPGGILILEDCIFSSSFCFPHVPVFERRLQLIKQLFEATNKNYDFGKQLYEILKEIGFSNINTNLIQPILDNAKTKSILPLFLHETQKTMVLLQLSSNEEIKYLNEMLINEIVLTSRHLVTGAQMCQISVRK